MRVRYLVMVMVSECSVKARVWVLKSGWKVRGALVENSEREREREREGERLVD